MRQERVLGVDWLEIHRAHIQGRQFPIINGYAEYVFTLKIETSSLNIKRLNKTFRSRQWLRTCAYLYIF
jgi:hypothetical protein